MCIKITQPVKTLYLTSFACRVCRQEITHQPYGCWDAACSGVQADCDPMVVKHNGAKEVVCQRCKDRYFANQRVSLLSDPQNADIQARLLMHARAHFGQYLEVSREAITFCSFLMSKIGRVTRQAS